MNYKYPRHPNGLKFGRLTVLGESPERGMYGHIYWDCLCDCGNFKQVARVFLKRGDTKSCGCYRRELGIMMGKRIYIKHGDAGYKANERSKLYGVWAEIKSRCSNPNDSAYRIYGKRGIAYCKNWEDYPTFKGWALLNGYAEGMVIHRIDHDGDYEPGNCQWLTNKEHNQHHVKFRRRDRYGKFV